MMPGSQAEGVGGTRGLLLQALLAGAVAGALGGVLAGALAGGATGVRDAGAAVGPDSDEARDRARLVRALDECTRALEELALRGASTDRGAGGSTGASGGEREAVGDAAPVDDLTAAIQELNRLLSNLPGELGRTGRGPGTFLRVPEGARGRAQLFDLAERFDHEELTRRFQFLTYQDVLDRFGRPDEMSANNWFYRDKAREMTITFQFADGFTYAVYD